MRVRQERQKCIFMLCMEVVEEDMEVQEETVRNELDQFSKTLFYHFFK